MMNKKKFSFSAALLLAAALIASGCQQQQKPADPTPNPTPTPDPKPAPNGTAILPVTATFEGRVVHEDEETGAKTDYLITVSLSNNKVGATAETVSEGYFYIGKNEYDAESGTIDVTLADTRGVREAISLTATYEKATDTLVITEFAGRERKAILPRITKSGDNRSSRYHAMVALEQPLGTSYLSLIINGQNVTGVLVTGQAGSRGSVSTLRTYNGTGYIRRGRELFVEIPLDTSTTAETRKTVEVRAEVKDGVLSNLKVYIAGSQYATHEQHTGQTPNMYSKLPLYYPVRFTLNTKAKETERTTNRKAQLWLRAVPLVTSNGTDVEVLNNNNKGYKLAGYRMYARFTGITSGTHLGESVLSAEAQADALFGKPEYTAGSAGLDAEKASQDFKGVYTFTFAATAFDNGATFQNNLGFTIKDWRPVTDGTNTETVTSGEYIIEILSASNGNLPSADGVTANDVQLKDFFGSAEFEPLATTPQDGIMYAPVTGALATYVPLGESTAVGAVSKKAKHIFDNAHEGFKQINAARP